MAGGGGGGEESSSTRPRPDLPQGMCAREGRGWGALGTRRKRRIKRGWPKSPGRARHERHRIISAKDT